MRTDSFSKDKHLPVRRFIADESKVATGLYGPSAIADDLDNIFNMFDPDATFLDGNEQGGISEKNLQNGAVSYDKLAEEVKEKFQEIATEQQLDSLRTELLGKADIKADKATSLSGYGITDAYTKDETDGFFGEVHTAISQKTEETVLYEETVNTPIWANQPTYEGTLDFDTSDYYYVTLNGADGAPLPDNQFMLKTFYTDNTPSYSTVFYLPGRLTGKEILKENVPVEFTADYKMRNAGVPTVEHLLNKSLDSSLDIKITSVGEFIKTDPNDYVCSYYFADKNVSNYHSGAPTTWNSDASKYIWHYIGQGNDDGKIRKFVDEFRMMKKTDKYFTTERKHLSRVLLYGGTSYKNYTSQTIGFGAAETGTVLTKVVVYSVRTTGYLRNGTMIRITEVK